MIFDKEKIMRNKFQADDKNKRGYKKVCITNRHLVTGDFIARLEFVLKSKDRPDILILREKDLSENEYETLAEKVLKLCEDNQTQCILHNFKDTAIKLGAKKIHLPMPVFESMPEREKSKFDTIGVSIHSKEEAVKAQKMNASYVMAGHIFETDCKKGKEPRGIKFLEEVCESIKIPVYAIGGINEENSMLCVRAGAAGVCMMSGYMCGN